MKKLDNNVKFKILAVILIIILCIAITPITFQNDTYYTCLLYTSDAADE